MSPSLDQHAPPAVEAPPTLPPTLRQRSILIDVVRGLAITLVAFGHTDQGVQHRGWWGASHVGLRIGAAIYAFHMPAFFFISGIFLCASVEKRGPLRFTQDKLRTMIWPYLLFSILGGLVIHLSSRFIVQGQLSPGQFTLLLLTGALSWFLPTIFFVVILGMLARKLPMPVFFLIAAAVSTWYPQTGIAFVTRGLKFLPFLALGMAVGFAYERIERIPLALALPASLLLVAVIAFATRHYPPDTSWTFIPLGIAGTAMLLLMARLLGHTSLARFIGWIGEGSISIFLLSPFAQTAGRELLLRLAHVTNPWAQSLFPTFLAVVIPAWLYAYRHRLHIAWMFVFPR